MKFRLDADAIFAGDTIDESIENMIKYLHDMQNNNKGRSKVLVSGRINIETIHEPKEQP